MAKRKVAKGDTLVCVPCGAELIVSELGTAYSEQWCCGMPMKPAPPKKAAAAKKPAARKAAAGKKAGKKAPAKKAPARRR